MVMIHQHRLSNNKSNKRSEMMDRGLPRKVQKLIYSSPLQDVYDVLAQNKGSLAEANLMESSLFEQIRCALNVLDLKDVGMDEEWVSRKVQSPLYIPIVEEDCFHIVVLVLPAGSCIPLHNHPGMTVFSRVLEGALKLRSFDILPSEAKSSERSNFEGGALNGNNQEALLSVCKTFDGNKDTSNGAWALGPQEGNIHEFTAAVPTVVFDILTPPYDTMEGRRCTYYREEIRGKPSGDDLGSSSERLYFSVLQHQPSGLPQYMRYFGPQIQN